jgi:hypothetical protein
MRLEVLASVVDGTKRSYSYSAAVVPGTGVPVAKLPVARF